MKILVINGSPKGKTSNTYKLTCAFLDGMKLGAEEEKDMVQLEELQVNQLELKPCLGCFGCWNKTPGSCCIQDHMQEVIAKLLWADIVIWSFPLYYYTVPGGLKTLIDRQLPMALPFMAEREDGVGEGAHPSRYDMSGKKTVLISTCGFYTTKGNYDGIYSLFDHMCGKNQYTSIFCGQGELFRVPEVSARTGEYLEYVRRAGREYVKGGISEKTWELLSCLLYPKEIFERMADASWGISKENGTKESEALIFTRQMAALYRKESFPGRERVLEMYYTDIDECYQIVMGKEGSRVLTDDFETFTTRIETPVTLWRSIGAGEIRGDEALMKRLYKVKGDFDLMLKWDDCFGLGKSDGNDIKNKDYDTEYDIDYGKRANTNMMIFLAPWIIFWTAVPFDGYRGAFFCLGACALLPLFFYQNKKTIYDLLSGACTAVLALALLAGIAARMVIPLSYFVFGLMWIVSCFLKIPLSAHYSMNGYGGTKALKNPLFIKTNWILTLLWGILYLVTPVWTYEIMGTEAASLTGLVNAALPVGMGIFTGWFQKWYPAKVARGE